MPSILCTALAETLNNIMDGYLLAVKRHFTLLSDDSEFRRLALIGVFGQDDVV